MRVANPLVSAAKGAFLLKRFATALAVFVALVVVAVVSAAGYRAWRQYEGERSLAIATPNGIDEGTFVSVNGAEQWITIRGSDRHNPVLLVVHGGPGTALSPLAMSFLPYERDWTVVQWDQPGAGRTFARAGGTLPTSTTVASIAADGVVVTELVRQRLGAAKVVLLGLSFGSVVGLEMARLRPDLYSAYVGTGLFVHRDAGREIAYERVLARARTQNNSEAVTALEAIGAPPHELSSDARTLSRWADALTGAVEGSPATRVAELLLAPRQSLGDFASYFGGYVASDEQFDLGAMDLRKSGTRFALPIVVIQGAEDLSTPIELARSYFESISAPRKAFVALPNGGHTALVYDRASFLAALNQHVLPFAGSAEP
jgi:pimeloyl-ACP methyl ester carboxylesterase